jgi:Uma2 family endonuclease
VLAKTSGSWLESSCCIVRFIGAAPRPPGGTGEPGIPVAPSFRDGVMLHAVQGPKRRATYEDLMQVPDTKVAEIIDGELIVSPRPASPHAHAATGIAADTLQFHGPPGSVPGPGGWWLLPEPELHFGDDVLVPDWAGWRRERLPVLENVPFFTLAPDWVCEIVSPSTGRVDRSRKMPRYAADGVAHLWLVDPSARTLEIYRLEAGRWIVAAAHGGDDVVRAEPFDAIEIRLARWWLPG